MSPAKQLEAFAQSVYLTTKNRYYDEITGEDGQVFISQTIDWTNMYLDELENTVGPDGKLVDWWFARSTDLTLGTAIEGTSSVSAVPGAVDRLIADEMRTVRIKQDDVVVSSFAVVQPGDISSRTDRIVEDTCAMVGTSLVFSRPFKDYEAGGLVVGDAMTDLPRLARNNVRVLSIVKPKQLLILGVAKNATLPDIVQGGLSPSYVQKYNALLQGAITRSMQSSVAREAVRENFSHIRGL